MYVVIQFCLIFVYDTRIYDNIEQADTHHIDCSLIHIMVIQISNLLSTLLSFRQKSFLAEPPVSLPFDSGMTIGHIYLYIH